MLSNYPTTNQLSYNIDLVWSDFISSKSIESLDNGHVLSGLIASSVCVISCWRKQIIMRDFTGFVIKGVFSLLVFVIQDVPMDLTDINPTIISTDTEDEDHADGTCQKLRRKLSFKNPVVGWFSNLVLWGVVWVSFVFFQTTVRPDFY